ncbi:MAG: metallophosphoesterase family protein [Deltaproteobacteria bacterium]|nr:MAG: metallophosphoesterase family protein [Deltaproteobacteria bacterium]
MRTLSLVLLLLACKPAEPEGRLPSFERPAAPTCPARVLADATTLPRAPYLNSVGAESLVVAFGAPSTSAVGLVRFTDAAGTVREVGATREVVPGDGSDLALFHARVAGLEPGTTYCYEVLVNDVSVASGLRFTTSVPGGFDTTVRFLAIGDFGAGTPEQLEVRDAMLPYAADADLFLTLGDNAYSSGTFEEWQSRVFAPNRELLTDVAYWPTWGNHDYATDDAAPALANHFLPEMTLRADHDERYWSFDHGPLHVIGLDSEGALYDTGDDDQIVWGTADLAAHADAPWKIALWHKPPFTGHETRTGDLFARARLQPMIEEAGVDVVLVGHDHFYERFHAQVDGEAVAHAEGGVSWIISGGGGRSLYVLDGHELEAFGEARHHFLYGVLDQCSLRIQAIGTDGLPFDELSLSRCED